MPKFDVTFSYTESSTWYATLEVEAADIEEASKIADAISENRDNTGDTLDGLWGDGAETASGVAVSHIITVPPSGVNSDRIIAFEPKGGPQPGS